jgi:acetyl-CoA carboxylase biotin carboxyl carrier protein
VPVAAAPARALHEIKSPMVGTFYRASSPDAEAYVRVGDMVENGRVLCIVEAMKLMNEIESEIRGRIVDILVENAQPVEFGQVLFRVDTTAA